MKKYIYTPGAFFLGRILIFLVFLCGLGVLILINVVFRVPPTVEKEYISVVDKLKNDHRADVVKNDETVDPFGDDGVVDILLVGLDARVGETMGHCDAIQLITINKIASSVVITAVPRGTYSPLPAGKGATSSDYYISNACGLGGLEYGINQIEKILGKKADYLVVVGFSEVLGILRNLKLPAISTLRWLRQRQSYAAGEPQRAHDHSTFLKYLLTKYIPSESSRMNKVWQYIMYKTVQTNLSFADTQALVEILSSMNLANNPERIRLTMRPAYDVRDIEYAPENLDEYLDTTLDPIKKYLSTDDYSDASIEETQARLLEVIESKKDDPDFIGWVFENNLWLQIEDKDTRLATQYNFLEKHIQTVSGEEERESLISDYILEMEQLGEGYWVKRGEELLTQ